MKELEQGPGADETYHGRTDLINSALPNNHFMPRIAYNRNDSSYPYMVVFTYDGMDDMSDMDIYAEPIHGTTNSGRYAAGIDVAAYGISPYNEAWADVAFAAGNENYYQPNPDQYLVTFICGYGEENGYGALCARRMKASEPYNVLEEWWEYQTIDESGADRNIMNTTVTGTIYHNNYLVVWDEQFSEGSDDFDLWQPICTIWYFHTLH